MEIAVGKSLEPLISNGGRAWYGGGGCAFLYRIFYRIL